MALILITGFCLLSIVYSTVIDFVPSYRLFGPTIRNIELGESPIVLPKLTKSVDFTKVLRTLYGQLLQPVSSKTFNANDLKVYALDKSAFWNSSLGDSICIVDIDSAKLGGVNHHGSGWRDRQRVTAGMLNHYAFARIHSYSYFMIRAQNTRSGTPSWSAISTALSTLPMDQCRFNVFLDLDSGFTNLDLPLEWLLNRWHIRDKTSLAIIGQGSEKSSKRPEFVVVQNTVHGEQLVSALAWQEGGNLMGQDQDRVVKISCEDVLGCAHKDARQHGIFLKQHWTMEDLDNTNFTGGLVKNMAEKLHAEYHLHRVEIMSQLPDEAHLSKAGRGSLCFDPERGVGYCGR